MSYMIYDIMLTRASLAIPVGKVDFALSGAAELGVERVHVHVHILIGKESKYVPLFDFVLNPITENRYWDWEFRIRNK